MIGTSREKVTRRFADLKKRQIVESRGIDTPDSRNKAALKALTTNRITAAWRAQFIRAAPIASCARTGSSAISLPEHRKPFFEQGRG